MIAVDIGNVVDASFAVHAADSVWRSVFVEDTLCLCSFLVDGVVDSFRNQAAVYKAENFLGIVRTGVGLGWFSFSLKCRDGGNLCRVGIRIGSLSRFALAACKHSGKANGNHQESCFHNR